MTTQKSFKRLVRTRMEKTGERYAAARAALLNADEPAGGGQAPLITTDATIRERTGRGWEEWFDLLDEWGAAELAHKEIAKRVAAELGIDALAWNAQAVTVSYERARGGRAVGQRSDGYAVTLQRTVPVAVDELYDAFVDGRRRRRWLPDDQLRERTATRPKRARYDWGDGGSRVHVTFLPKGERSSTLALEHMRLADGEEADRMKAFWRERVGALKEALETTG
jgi:uncharacterized protein YndB with AHSA1/START domain